MLITKLPHLDIPITQKDKSKVVKSEISAKDSPSPGLEPIGRLSLRPMQPPKRLPSQIVGVHAKTLSILGLALVAKSFVGDKPVSLAQSASNALCFAIEDPSKPLKDAFAKQPRMRSKGVTFQL